MSADVCPSMLDDFRQSLQACRDLYRQAGERCQHHASVALSRSPKEFLEWMEDLHRGLLLKVYLEVALADHRWDPCEQKLAELLFEHIWEQRLTGKALREAARELQPRAQKLTLRSLVQPFIELPELSDFIQGLHTVVIRLAHLIAKADGQLVPTEAERIRIFQESLRALLPRPSASPKSAASPPPLPRPAVAQVQENAEQLRKEYDWKRPAVDSPSEQAAPRVTIAEAMEKLDALVGLAAVKQEIRTLTNFLKIQQQREQAGLPTTPVSLHLVFAGNPGTGKTTVARVIGEIYGAMGLLEKGHLVETDRSGLVAEYAGQTAPKTHAIVDQALGGVLFIDEAYSLVAEQGEDTYGREALQTLLKRMEDDRGRVAVILAGYTAPMERLLKANPGLSSRFHRNLSFEDYGPQELAEIFGRLCEVNHYQLSSSVRSRLLIALQQLHRQRDEHFGNGRLVRNLFENAIRRMANRIAEITPLTHDVLTQFHPEDLEFPGLDEKWWQHILSESVVFRTECPGCGRRCQLAASNLGRKMRCPKCGVSFSVPWAEPSATTE